MNFGKQFLASLLGSTVALIAAGTILIFIFVGAQVGGLSSAFAEAGDDIESDFDFGVDIEEGAVLHLTFDAPFVERGMEVPVLSFGLARSPMRCTCTPRGASTCGAWAWKRPSTSACWRTWASR